MENFKTVILKILQQVNREKFASLDDIYLYDYKDIDEETQRSELNFKKLRGSVRLSSEKIKLPSDMKKLRDEYYNMQLP